MCNPPDSRSPTGSLGFETQISNIEFQVMIFKPEIMIVRRYSNLVGLSLSGLYQHYDTKLNDPASAGSFSYKLYGLRESNETK